MEANTNCDLGMLYEDGKNQMSGQGVLVQTFFLNTNKETISPQKTPPPKKKQTLKCQTPPSQFVLCCGFGFAFLKRFTQKADAKRTP